MDNRDLIENLRHELAAPLPEPSYESAASHGQDVLAWLGRHWATLPEQPIGKTASPTELARLLGGPPPESGTSFQSVLAEFAEHVAPFAFRVNHPRFLAFIPGAPSFAAVLADLLCAGTNFFAGVWLEAAGPAQIELLVLDWFKQFLGYPAEAAGILTSGGSEANLTALVVAREELVSTDRGRAVLYVTDQRHWSIDRAARIAGFGSDQIRPIPLMAGFRLNPAALADLVRKDRSNGLLPWAVVANAGSTNTGAIDPLEELAELCGSEKLWLHVDAAYGWPAVLVPEEQPAFSGLPRADSITLDPHKWFAQPFEAGCVLIKNGRQLRETFAMRPDYMQDVVPDEEEVNFADHGLALTRRFRALKIWFSIKVLGLSWFRNMIARSCALARFAEALLRQAGCFEILSERQLSIVCFRYVPDLGHNSAILADKEIDGLNLAIVDAVRSTGRAFFSSTRLAGRVALRLCFVNWRTVAADVEEVVRLIETAGRNQWDDWGVPTSAGRGHDP